MVKGDNRGLPTQREEPEFANRRRHAPQVLISSMFVHDTMMSLIDILLDQTKGVEEKGCKKIHAKFLHEIAC